MKEFWDERYSQAGYAYGEQPNAYLKEKLTGMHAGKILFPAEGEGRNAVYAASMGWSVYAFDLSGEGKRKALQLAGKFQVELNYAVGEFGDIIYDHNQFDAIGLIFAHFPAHLKTAYHKALVSYLKPGGTLIMEAFSKKHTDYIKRNEKVGGPRNIEILLSAEDILSDFSGLEIIELAEQEVELTEGLYHNGTAHVVRFTGRKP